MYNLENIIKKLQPLLSEKRFHHSLRTAAHARNLASKLNYSPEKAFVAGLLHDCARDLSDKQLLKETAKYQLKISAILKKNPALLHGLIGAQWAQEKFNINEPQIIKAIRNHTHGSAKMSLLEKIIFVADFTEVERKFPEAEIVKNTLAQINNHSHQKNIEILNQAITQKAQFMLSYARKKKWQVHNNLLKLAKNS